MDKPIPNPFIDARLIELSDAAERMAGELMSARSRTPEERGRLALRCAHLLMVLGRRVAPGNHMPHQPEHNLQPNSLAASFGAWVEKECAAVRWLAIGRAVDSAKGAGAVDVESVVEPDAWHSDEAMRRVFEALQARVMEKG